MSIKQTIVALAFTALFTNIAWAESTPNDLAVSKVVAQPKVNSTNSKVRLAFTGLAPQANFQDASTFVPSATGELTQNLNHASTADLVSNNQGVYTAGTTQDFSQWTSLRTSKSGSLLAKGL